PFPGSRSRQPDPTGTRRGALRLDRRRPARDAAPGRRLAADPRPPGHGGTRRLAAAPVYSKREKSEQNSRELMSATPLVQIQGLQPRAVPAVSDGQLVDSFGRV